MDFWTYLKGLRRWWWLLLVVPAAAFALASFLIVPPAKWEVRWTSTLVLDGDPNLANQSAFLDYVLLDDMTHLLHSGALGDIIYRELPDTVTERYSRDDVGAMYDSFRHARFVEFTVAADDPDVAKTVAETTIQAMPDAINRYLLPPDFPRFPAYVRVTTMPSEPELETRDRLIAVGGITLAGAVVGAVSAGVAEWLRLSYREKYGAR